MDKKKVGVVTFHTADNYGAVLQAYALQEYITRHLKCDVEIIDFNTPIHEEEHRIFQAAPDIIRSFIYGLFALLHYASLKKRVKRFKEFRLKQLHLTSHRYTSEHDFLNNIQQFDFYISGSDQVFNPKVRYRDCYYLGFPKNGGMKIAYAPSFGLSAFSQEDTDYIKKMVSDFDYLSCREKNGAEFLSSLLGREIPVVCDPVFLLTKQEWEAHIPRCAEKEPYIFVYDLCGGYQDIALAKKVSRALGNIKIICATTHTRVNYSGVKVFRNMGPFELLSYIRGSECVVTDSFHGTALSLVLEKKVISYIANKKVSSRIESVAKSLDVENQIIYDIESFEWNAIQFNHYRKELNQFTEYSRQFLSNALK